MKLAQIIVETHSILHFGVLVSLTSREFFFQSVGFDEETSKKKSRNYLQRGDPSPPKKIVN